MKKAKLKLLDDKIYIEPPAQQPPINGRDECETRRQLEIPPFRAGEYHYFIVPRGWQLAAGIEILALLHKRVKVAVYKWVALIY